MHHLHVGNRYRTPKTCCIFLWAWRFDRRNALKSARDKRRVNELMARSGWAKMNADLFRTFDGLGFPLALPRHVCFHTDYLNWVEFLYLLEVLALIWSELVYTACFLFPTLCQNFLVFLHQSGLLFSVTTAILCPFSSISTVNLVVCTKFYLLLWKLHLLMCIRKHSCRPHLNRTLSFPTIPPVHLSRVDCKIWLHSLWK